VSVKVGATFAGYTILRMLGSGGMGEVHLAEHPRLPRRNALKVLPADVSADAEYRARFNREADLASTLWHPHIVGVHDRGEEDGQLWISMNFVDGLDAARLLADRYPAGMPVEEVPGSSRQSPVHWITPTNKACCTEMSSQPTS
jgi:serine/threonine protein kinase, bacterial